MILFSVTVSLRRSRIETKVTLASLSYLCASIVIPLLCLTCLGETLLSLVIRVCVLNHYLHPLKAAKKWEGVRQRRLGNKVQTDVVYQERSALSPPLLSIVYYYSVRLGHCLSSW